MHITTRKKPRWANKFPRSMCAFWDCNLCVYLRTIASDTQPIIHRAPSSHFHIHAYIVKSKGDVTKEQKKKKNYWQFIHMHCATAYIKLFRFRFYVYVWLKDRWCSSIFIVYDTESAEEIHEKIPRFFFSLSIYIYSMACRMLLYAYILPNARLQAC